MWNFVGFNTDERMFLIDGINVWAFKWKRDGSNSIVVPHPQYPQQRHRMDVYTISDGVKTVKFATGEFSWGVWGFYVPSGEPDPPMTEPLKVTIG